MNDNWGLIGHSWAVDLLQGHISAGRTRHAYLITGAEGVGRRTLALAFTKAVNCQSPPTAGKFCDRCRACQLTDQLQHPDLHLVEKEPDARELKIDQIRELQRGLSLAPYEANYRIALLPDFDSASRSAANALLKTLEEPNSRVILLLTAFSAELLLPTITSRCDLVRLRTPSAADTAQGLQEKFNLAQDEAKRLAQIAGGRPGLAVRFQQTPALLDKRQEHLDDLVQLTQAPIRERFKFAETLSRNRKGRSRAEQLAVLRVLLHAWESFWRDVLLLKTGMNQKQLTNPDFLEPITLQANQAGLPDIERRLISLEKAGRFLEANANIRLTLESLLLDM